MTVRCVYDGFVVLAGVPTLVRHGDEYDDNDPAVAERPDLFTQPAAPPPVQRETRPEARQSAKAKTDG